MSEESKQGAPGGASSVDPWMESDTLRSENDDLRRENTRLKEEIAQWRALAEKNADHAQTAIQTATAKALENTPLKERVATMEAAIRWALGEQPSRDGRWFDARAFGWVADVRIPPFWWRTFLRLFSEVDFTHAPAVTGTRSDNPSIRKLIGPVGDAPEAPKAFEIASDSSALEKALGALRAARDECSMTDRPYIERLANLRQILDAGIAGEGLPRDPSGKLWIGYCDLCNEQHCLQVLKADATIERAPHRALSGGAHVDVPKAQKEEEK